MTQPIGPPIVDAPGTTPADPGGTPDRNTKQRGSGLGRATQMMAVASMASRVTGFLRQVALVAVLGVGVLNDSYTVANTLPNIVYELLLGGVLTSIMIPLLVRAQTEDADGGVTYTRRLLTISGVALIVATSAAMAAAPLLTRLYLGNDDTTANPQLATALAFLLLPQIFFYGVGALLGALLNTREVFGPFAWAPVLNNIVVLAILGCYVLVPGEISLNPVRMGEPKLLVLGLGTTLGIVVQALVLLPAVRRIGFRYRPVWGWDRRLNSAGGLALWVIAYTVVGQIGYIVTTRVAAAADPGSVTIYSNAWLLLQVPYGVLGVSLLTALMPRMSRAAAEGRTADLIADLSLGARLSAVALIPVSAALTIFGTAVGVALFGYGAAADGESPVRLGAALAVSAFGLLPYALTLLQLRVFYALTDSRTPTLLQTLTVGVKVPLLLACPLLFPPEQVVLGLTAANSMSFVVGAIAGQLVLRRRLGQLRSRAVLGTITRTTIASVIAGALAYTAVALVVGGSPMEWSTPATGWAVLIIGGVVFALALLPSLWLLRTPEIDPLWRRLRRRPTPRRQGSR